MSIITLFSAFMGLYVIVRLILPSGMNWPLKLILSLLSTARWAHSCPSPCSSPPATSIPP